MVYFDSYLKWNRQEIETSTHQVRKSNLGKIGCWIIILSWFENNRSLFLFFLLFKTLNKLLLELTII